MDGSDLVVEVHTESTERVELITLTQSKTETSSEVTFTGKGWFKPNQMVRLVVSSKKLLFEVNSKHLRVNEQNCEMNRVQFEGKLGIFLVGSIKLPNDIDSIDLVVKLSSDGSVVHSSVISGLNGFRVGPLKSPASLYAVELSKESFLFSKSLKAIDTKVAAKDEFHLEFVAQKLGQLKVKIFSGINIINFGLIFIITKLLTKFLCGNIGQIFGHHVLTTEQNELHIKKDKNKNHIRNQHVKIYKMVYKLYYFVSQRVFLLYIILWIQLEMLNKIILITILFIGV